MWSRVHIPTLLISHRIHTGFSCLAATASYIFNIILLLGYCVSRSRFNSLSRVALLDLTMSLQYKAIIFDLGGVLLNWDPSSITALSSGQLRSIMHSTVWYELDRGNISLHEACEVCSCLESSMRKCQLTSKSNLAA